MDRRSLISAFLGILLLACLVGFLVMHPERIRLDSRLETLLTPTNQAWPEHLQHQYRSTLLNGNQKETITILLSITNDVPAAQARVWLRRAAREITKSIPTFIALAPMDIAQGNLPHNYINHVLTPADRALLDQNEEITTKLTQRLYQNITVIGKPHFFPIADDPFGWTQQKILTDLSQSPMISDNGYYWVRQQAPTILVMGRVNLSAFAFGKGEFTQVLHSIQKNLESKAHTQGYTLQWTQAGLPILTDATAQRSQEDFSRIGLYSSIAIFLFAWLALGQIRTVLSSVVVLSFSLGVGLLAGWALFGQLHAITLVLGLTIIGVAFDYCAHWWLSGVRATTTRLCVRRNHYAKTLFGAAASSLCAYASLTLTPLTGLSQMAFVTGVTLLTALWLILTFGSSLPILFPQKRLRFSQWATNLACKYPAWSDLHTGARVGFLALIFSILLPLGFLSLGSGLKDLQSVPLRLLQAHQQVEKTLALPSTQQYYLVEGSTLERALQRREKLRTTLQHLAPHIQSYSLSDWVPSITQQQKDFLRIEKAYQKMAPTLTQLGLAPTPKKLPWLTPDHFTNATLTQNLSLFFCVQTPRQTVLKVYLKGVTPKDVQALSSVQLSHTYWVNRTQALESGLIQARNGIFAGLAITLILLTLFWKRHWYHILPTVFGLLVPMSLHAMLGWPITLFTSLALVFIVGLGLDYTLFMRDHQGSAKTLFAIWVSAITSIISFGSLLLSTTPAFASLGLTIASGLMTIALVTPIWFRRTS